MDTGDIRDRIVALETHVAHQEATIEALNATVTRQWRLLDALAREVASLADRIEQGVRRDPAAPEPPPPHY